MTEIDFVITTPPGESGLNNIGKLLPNTEAKVVDIDTGVSKSDFSSGELLVRGPSVSKLNRFQRKK